MTRQIAVGTPAGAALKAQVRAAAFAALVGALGLLPPVPVPIIPVPITAQSFGVMLTGLLLAPRRAAMAMGLFLVLVALGLPLLAGGRGGLGALAGPGAGFVLAWPLAALVTALTSRALPVYRPWTDVAAALIGGVGAMYAVGVPWMAWRADLTLSQAAIGAAAFLPGDVTKAVLAGVAAGLVRRGYPALAT